MKKYVPGKNLSLTRLIARKGWNIIQTYRLQALDVFRGMTIALMILVNTPGSWSYVYAPLEHASWHGCTPTDLVFPFFLFVMGVAMPYSLRHFDHKLSSAVGVKILKRVLLIFLIGLALNFFPFKTGLSDLRIFGVLQRIAITYGIAAILCLCLNRIKLILLSGMLLIGYWLLLLGFSIGEPYSLEGNLVRFVDLAVIGAGHMWHGKVIAFDPEGLLSTLPAVVTVLIGYLAGHYIQFQADLRQAVYKTTLAGIVAVVAGWVWGVVFPINKSLWTSSYVLYTSGLALIILSFCLYVVDVKGYKKWSMPFYVFGRNSLFIYVISIIWVKTLLYLIRVAEPGGSVVSGYNWIFQEWFLPAAGYYNGSLLFALAHVALFWMLALFLDKKKIYVKI